MNKQNVGPKKSKFRVILIASAIVLVVLCGAAAGLTYLAGSSGGDLLTQNLSEPLSGATVAKIDIDPGDGNLAIDGLITSEQLLASGTLQYLENLGLPSQSVDTSSGTTTLVLRSNGGGQPWFRLPWAACNGATDWQVHLNPTVQSDLTAHSDGGNVRLNLAGMALTRLAADTGGGNVNVVLPDNAADLSVTAKTGAGNVTVEIGNGITGSSTIDASSGAGNVVVTVPSGVAVRIHVTGGLGKITVDPQFSQVDGATYQSLDYDTAANKIEITVSSGAGDVTIDTK